MAVGGISSRLSTHQAGMSALWHDVDHIPAPKIDIPLVGDQLGDMPLPSEEHRLPSGEAAFERAETAYDDAFVAYSRGLEGLKFFHGTKKLDEGEDEMNREAITRTMVAPRMVEKVAVSLGAQEQKIAIDQAKKSNAAGRSPIRTSNASESSSAREKSKAAEQTLKAAEGLGISIGAISVSQVLDLSGAAGAGAASAMQAVQAVGVAKTAVGMTTPMKDTAEEGRVARRGLAKRSVK